MAETPTATETPIPTPAPTPAPANTTTTVVSPPAVGGESALGNNSGKNNPATFDRSNNSISTSTIDVVHNYKWTLSQVKDRTDIPEIKLYEHRNTEPALKRQVLFYGLGLKDQLGTEFQKWASGLPFIGGAIGAGMGPWGALAGVAAGSFLNQMAKNDQAKSNASGDMLSVYDEIFPDSPTGNSYIFPYFTKTYMELNSPKWEQMDDIAQSIDSIAGGAARIARGAGNVANEIGFSGIGRVGEMTANVIDVARETGGVMSEAYKFYLRGQYPLVGVYDRPRIFSSHNERDVTIEFPLYNTHDPADWAKNRDLIYRLMTQFLYIKKSYITGIPPVFYRVLVPYQYFSFASCITNFKVENLGNLRKMYDMVVPDAYQITLTLTEMVMPSLNQFQYASRPKVESRSANSGEVQKILA